MIENGLELPFPLPERRLRRPQPEERPNGCDELFRLHRLDQIRVRAVFERLQPVRAASGRCRDVQDEDGGRLGVGLETPADFQPAHVGHVDVEQDERGLVLGGEAQRLRAGGRLEHGEAGLTQRP